jgi:hypothetical protein
MRTFAICQYPMQALVTRDFACIVFWIDERSAI